MNVKHEPLSLPAIRGKMGNWEFYSAVMPILEMAKRINYATEIHTNTGLADMIQRKLSGKRAEEIREYLTQRPDRFFNSLVIAFYDGPPTWFSGSVSPFASSEEGKSFDIEDIRESGAHLGVLRLTGNETLFALDGQHRLSGIKSAFKKHVLPADDCVPVIFVAHSNSESGIRRSREIFTTLNKEVKKVGVGDIIALDENDPAAIVTRMIVDSKTGLSGKKIAYKQTESIDPRSDVECVTTIANIYFSFLNIFKRFHYPGLSIRNIAALPRPNDDEIKLLFKLANSFLSAIGSSFPEFGAVMSAATGAVEVIKRNRTTNGGHLLFRPVGITIFTNLVCQMKSSFLKLSIADCVKRMSKLPVNLNEAPYRGLLWVPETGRMQPSRKKIIIDLLGSDLGLPQGKQYQRSVEEYEAITKEKYEPILRRIRR